MRVAGKVDRLNTKIPQKASLPLRFLGDLVRVTYKKRRRSCEFQGLCSAGSLLARISTSIALGMRKERSSIIACDIHSAQNVID